MTFGPLDIVIVLALSAVPFRHISAYGTLRRLAWSAGVALTAVATFGHLGGDPRHTFLATTIQFTLLFFVAPVLLALGYAGEPRSHKLISMLGPVLACVVTLAWFLTPWLKVSMSHYLLYQAGHLLALAAGWLFCAPAVRARGLEAGAYPALILVAFLELLLDAIPGIIVTIRHDLLAPSVFLAHHSAAAAHTSQVHGGEVLWVIAEILDIPFLAALVFQWVRADARHAAVIDARLDAHIAPPADGNTGERQRPWWETDASVFGDRAKTFERDD